MLLHDFPVSPSFASKSVVPSSSAIRAIPTGDVVQSAPSRETKSEKMPREGSPSSTVMIRSIAPDGFKHGQAAVERAEAQLAHRGERQAEMRTFFRMKSLVSGANSVILPSSKRRRPSVVARSQPCASFSIQITPAPFRVSAETNMRGPSASSDQTPVGVWLTKTLPPASIAWSRRAPGKG